MPAPAAVLTALQEKFPQVAARASLDHEAVDVAPADLRAVLQTLREAHGFDLLMDLTAIDWAEGAAPRFTMKFACTSETSASPTRSPLRPLASINRPAAPCGGFLKMHPALGSRGCVSWRFCR